MNRQKDKTCFNFYHVSSTYTQLTSITKYKNLNTIKIVTFQGSNVQQMKFGGITVLRQEVWVLFSVQGHILLWLLPFSLHLHCIACTSLCMSLQDYLHQFKQTWLYQDDMCLVLFWMHTELAPHPKDTDSFFPLSTFLLVPVNQSIVSYTGTTMQPLYLE